MSHAFDGITMATAPCPNCQTELHAVHLFCPHCRFPLMVVAGKYRLERVLGEGGFGTVYLARHLSLPHHARRVIKVIRPELFKVEEIALRFQREVRITAALSETNDHIVRIYDDFGEEPGLGHYYVMEYLQGHSLLVHTQAHKPMAPPLAFHIFSQLCEALKDAHAEGIVHRDLKPDNIFLIHRAKDPNFVKVIDFGIAKPLHTMDNHALTQGILGTPAYMSPEQCVNRGVDTRTDIYALGILLYEMLTGHLPFSFPADKSMVVWFSHLAEPPRSLNDGLQKPVFPEGLDRAILRAMAKEPHERYPTVLDFWAALEPFSDPTTWTVAADGEAFADLQESEPSFLRRGLLDVLTPPKAQEGLEILLSKKPTPPPSKAFSPSPSLASSKTPGSSGSFSSVRASAPTVAESTPPSSLSTPPLAKPPAFVQQGKLPTRPPLVSDPDATFAEHAPSPHRPEPTIAEGPRARLSTPPPSSLLQTQEDAPIVSSDTAEHDSISTDPKIEAPIQTEADILAAKTLFPAASAHKPEATDPSGIRVVRREAIRSLMSPPSGAEAPLLPADTTIHSPEKTTPDLHRKSVSSLTSSTHKTQEDIQGLQEYLQEHLQAHNKDTMALDLQAAPLPAPPRLAGLQLTSAPTPTHVSSSQAPSSVLPPASLQVALQIAPSAVPSDATAPDLLARPREQFLPPQAPSTFTDQPSSSPLSPLSPLSPPSSFASKATHRLPPSATPSTPSSLSSLSPSDFLQHLLDRKIPPSQIFSHWLSWIAVAALFLLFLGVLLLLI